MPGAAQGTVVQALGSRLLRQRSSEPDAANLRLADLGTVLLAWRGMGGNAITLFLASIGPHGSLGFLILIVTLAPGTAFP